jgi:hypothetical protein
VTEPLPSVEEIDRFAATVSDWLKEHARAWWYVANEGEKGPARKLERHVHRKVLGVGGTRVVFGLGRTHVLKIAIWSHHSDRRYTDSNAIEARTWQDASQPLRRLLNPVEAVAWDGSWLVMPRLVPLDPEPVPTRTKNLLIKLGIQDVFPWNVGRASDGRILCFDYDITSLPSKSGARGS